MNESSREKSRGIILAISLLTLAIAAANAVRVLFSPLQEVIKAALHLSDYQIGLVQGVAVSIPIALLSVPVGRQTDRGNRVRLLMGLAGLSAAGALMTAVVTNFWPLFIARMLAGLAAGCALPVIISIAADLSRAERRGRTLLFLSIGNMTGGALAFALGGWLLALLNSPHWLAMFHGMTAWRSAHLVFGALDVAVVLCLFALREPQRRETDDVEPECFALEMKAIWARRSLLLPLFIGQVTVVMADTAAVVWAPSVAFRDYHLQPAEFGGWIGLAIVVSGVVGSIAGGMAADVGHKSRIGGGILLGAVLAAALSLPAAFFPIMPTALGFELMLALLLLCGSMTGLITATAVAILVPNELRGVVLGAFMVVGAIIGLAVAPLLVTAISSALGGEAHVGAALAATTLATSAVALVGFLGAMRSASFRPATLR